MKIRHALVALSAIAVASLTLVGCSTGGSSSSGGSKSLTLYTYDDAAPSKLLQQTINSDFTKKTGITVKVDDLPGSGAAIYPGKLRTALAGGKGPDVWRTWGGSIGGPFATQGFALDLSKYWKQYDWSKLIPKSTQAGMTWNGATYGLPVVSNTVVAWYSKDAFQKAGITAAPTTYDELVADNAKLVAAGQVPVGLGGEYGWDVMRLFEYLLEKNVGPSVHDKLLAGKASWNQAGVVKSFTELKEWADKGWLPQGVMGLDPAITEPGFTQGKFAYTIAGGWIDSSDVQKASDPSAYGLFPLPTDQSQERTSGWVEGYMINKASPNRDESAKLLNWLTQPATLKKLGVTNTSVTGAAPDATKYPLSAQLTKIASTTPFYTIQDQAFPAKLANTYFDIQSKVVQGQLSAGDAAKQMQTAVPSGLKQ
jgi:raffinose/stachyose/melibiose transport system substrate-binding protein